MKMSKKEKLWQNGSEQRGREVKGIEGRRRGGKRKVRNKKNKKLMGKGRG